MSQCEGLPVGRRDDQQSLWLRPEPRDGASVTVDRGWRPRSRLLDTEEINRQLLGLAGWGGDTSAIRRTYQAPDFAAAIRMVDDVALDAAELDHHPDIDIRFRSVTFACHTWDAGGVTQLDIELAHRIADHAERRGAS